ncbi:hypothetical protein SAMN05216474_2477 [Lishizhenia tianjinensis]|uniref:Uncharacterized protein n=1 Tax=Lishizhenia tianjinensis TaxID=477690 RepID=A0A1I7B269_9FLAO|nr:hypothetical protein SAMN05216474_2477 [Lishizhenia tianjinensis]
MKVELHSILTCPHCGHKKEEIMPIDACQYFYTCENCKKRKQYNPNKATVAFIAVMEP